MVADLKASCTKDDSTLAIFLKGKMISLTNIQKAILQSNIIKTVQAAFASVAEVPLHGNFDLNLRPGAMEKEMHIIGNQVCHNTCVIDYNSKSIDAQQKAMTVTALETAECKLKLFGLGDLFEKLTDRTKQKLAVVNWIHTHLKEYVHKFGAVSITPIVPRGAPGFVILTFPSPNDARHFEGTVSRKRTNKVINSKISTQRWAINSSSLLAGDETSMSYIQEAIANSYNQHMEEAGLKYKLQKHHVKIIRIGTTQRFLKGKTHVVFDFLDPCNRVTSLLWYQGQDPFAAHDFSQAIPNPRTRDKANSNPEYAKCNLKDGGLWTVKPRINLR